MSGSLLALCLAALAMVAVPVSIGTWAILPWLDRLAHRVPPRHRGRLWLGAAALPGAVASVAVLVSLLPSIGLGSDHCLAHDPHHPHLCPHHMVGAPGLAVIALAIVTASRVLGAAVGFARFVRLSRATASALAEASERRGDVLVFASDEPRAFVLGALRPRVHASRGLLALGERVVEPVLAHERAHARHRHMLWRALCPALGAGHLPWVLTAIRARHATAQELAADGDAADELRDPVRVAEALITLARRGPAPTPGLAFTHGDLTVRVLALLEPSSPAGPWPVRLLVGGCLASMTSACLSHSVIHHGLETLLGALS